MNRSRRKQEQNRLYPKSGGMIPNHPLFQYRKAKEYLDKDSPLYDPAEAVRWLLLSAEQRYEYAQYRLGKRIFWVME